MKKIISALFIIPVLTLGSSLFGGSFILRDDRIKDTSLTPNLGRGYTMVTNSFQSICLEKIKLTDPSYDFKYKFQSIEKTGSAEGSRMKESLKNIDYISESTVKTAAGITEYLHSILVEIEMDTYYASVNESKSRMSKRAVKMLSSKDLPGFFSACGTFYVRSIGRNAKFISVFTYSDKSSRKDASFETALEMQIKQFTKGGSIKANAEFAKVVGEKKLTITTHAFGLGKDEEAALISYDIETFKYAIQNAFYSMQNPMTGKVTSVEIVPWVENVEFQSYVDLDKEVTDPDTGKTMLLYKKKQVLIKNSEYLAEIEKADRNMMNLYYKSKICRQTVDANWAKDGKLLPEYQGTKISNNNKPRQTMLLKTLYEKHLTNAAIQKLLEDEEKFMVTKAQKCIDKLLESGMFQTSWLKMPECNAIKGDLSAVGNDVIEEYCMPTLAK
jgi:hypothetical protein